MSEPQDSNIADAQPAAPGVRYPTQYLWLVLLAAMDLMLTWVILHLDGKEMNAIADAVIDRYGLWGLSAFKFGLIVFVVCLCEIIGRRNERSGKFLATASIALHCVPVSLALYLLLTH